MATTASTVFGTSTALTITLASLATSSTLLVGRNGTAVDISGITTIPIDILLGGSIMTGTTPTTAKIIEVWAAASENGTAYSGTVPATDAGLTMVAETKGLLRLVASMATNATSNTAYTFAPVSLASLYGGILPRKFNVFVTHSTGVNLNSTAGNQFISYTPINFQSA